jgi:predicted DNA-binding transcriptional regulator AlpA
MDVPHLAKAVAQELFASGVLLNLELFNTRECASYLGISRGELEKRRREGRGPPCVRIGRAVRYYRVDVDTWIRSGRAA